MSGVFIKEENGLTPVADNSATNIATLTSRIGTLESEVEYLSDSSVRAIYIDNVNGDDTNDGLTENSPIKTFPDMTFLNKLGTCEYFQFIFMSNYTGNITMPRKGNLVLFRSLDANNRITITGQTSITYVPSVILQDLNFTYATANNTLILQHCDVLVKDCDITNTSGSGANARTAISIETVACGEFRNCNVTARRCINVAWSNIYIRKQSGKNSVWTATLDYIATNQAGCIFTDDTYLPVTFVYPTGLMSKLNQYVTGLWCSSGSLLGQNYIEKLDSSVTTELTIYVDYANGSDDNDGLSDTTPIKTFDFQVLRSKYPIYPRFTVLFMSDYTGDITVENFTCIVFKSKDVTASNWETNSYTVNGKFVLNNINEVFLQFLKVASVGTGAGTDIYIQNCGVAYTGYLQVTNSSGATVNGRDIRVAKCANYIFRDVVLKNESTGNRYGFSFESSNVFAFGKPNSTKMTNITFGFDTYPSGHSENSQLNIPRDVFFTCGANQIMGPDFKGIVVMDGSIYNTVGDSTSTSGKYYYEGRKINLMPRYDFTSVEGMDGKSLKKPTGVTTAFQGLAIWNDIWIQLFNGGTWAMYDMNNPNNGNSIASGSLGSAGVDNHANSLTFGKMYDSNDPFPLLYVTGWIDDIDTGGTGSCCYVERLQSDGNDGYISSLLQTIVIDYTDFASSGYEVPYPYLNFMCDIDNGYLYTFSAKYRTNGSQSQYDNVNRYYITRFKIPDLANSSVTLTADDVLQQFTVPYDVDFTQGGTIFNNQMFCLFGDGNDTTHKNALRVYDLLEGCEVSKVDLSQTIWKAREPEDVHVYQGYLYSLTQNGYVRKMTF